MITAKLLAALVSLCCVWHTADGRAVLNVKIRRLGGELHLRRVGVKLQHASDVTGVPLEVAAVVTHAESGFVPRAASELGASGFLQLLPGTLHFREWKRVCALSPGECDVANLVIGLRVLKRDWEICGGKWRHAVARFRGLGCSPRKQENELAAKMRMIGAML